MCPLDGYKYAWKSMSGKFYAKFPLYACSSALRPVTSNPHTKIIAMLSYQHQKYKSRQHVSIYSSFCGVHPHYYTADIPFLYLNFKSASYSLLAKALGDNSSSRQSLHLTMHTWLFEHLLQLVQCGNGGTSTKSHIKYEP